LAQPLLDEKLVNLNIAKISEASEIPTEAVTSILAGIRDEIVDLIIVRKSSATLNFGFGSLFLRNGTVEFKSGNSTNDVTFDFDKIPHSAEFDEVTNAKNSVAFS